MCLARIGTGNNFGVMVFYDGKAKRIRCGEFRTVVYRFL